MPPSINTAGSKKKKKNQLFNIKSGSRNPSLKCGRHILILQIYHISFVIFYICDVFSLAVAVWEHISMKPLGRVNSLQYVL